MTSIIIAVGAMAVTGGITTMFSNIKPTRAKRKALIEQQFNARKFAGIAADAAAEIEVVSNGDGEAADGEDTEGPANPQ